MTAEVGIVFVPPGDTAREFVGHISFQARVQRIVVPVVTAGVAWCESAKALCTGTEIRIGLTRTLRPVFGAIFRTEGEGGWIRQSNPDGLGEVGVQYLLGVLQRAVIEAEWAAHTQGIVDGVLGAKAQQTVAEVVAEVPVQAIVGSALGAQHHATVARILIDFRYIAVRVNLRQQCALPAVVFGAIERERCDVAVTGHGGDIQAGVIANGQIGIQCQCCLIHIRVAQLECCFAHAREIAGVGRCALIGTGAIGHVLVAGLCRQMDGAAAAAQGQACITRQLPLLAIALGILAASQCNTASSAGALEHDIDDAADGIRSILCRCTITQDFHAFDSGDGDRVQINCRRATTDRAIHIHQRRNMAALAIDEHQRLIR